MPILKLKENFQIIRAVRMAVLAVLLSASALALSGCDLYCLASTGHMDHLCHDAHGNEIQCGCGR